VAASAIAFDHSHSFGNVAFIMKCARREFIKTTAILATGLATLDVFAASKASSLPEPTAAKLPRWKEFNLLKKFNAATDQPFREADFALMAE